MHPALKKKGSKVNSGLALATRFLAVLACGAVLYLELLRDTSSHAASYPANPGATVGVGREPRHSERASAAFKCFNRIAGRDNPLVRSRTFVAEQHNGAKSAP